MKENKDVKLGLYEMNDIQGFDACRGNECASENREKFTVVPSSAPKDPSECPQAPVVQNLTQTYAMFLAMIGVPF